jgi:hypothetical protein
LYGQGRELSLKLRVPTKEEVVNLQSKWSADGVSKEAERRGSVTERRGSVGGGAQSAPPGMITRQKLATWADGQDPWLGKAVRGPIAPFPEDTDDSQASAAVLGEWYLNACNAKPILEWVKQLDSSAEWLAWAGTTFRFKIFGGGTLPALFDNMYKSKDRLKMNEYAVMPTSLEQIFHAFAKEQTGSTEEQGVYSNDKEKALQELFASVSASSLPVPVYDPSADPVPPGQVGFIGAGEGDDESDGELEAYV